MSNPQDSLDHNQIVQDTSLASFSSIIEDSSSKSNSMHLI